MTRIIAATVLGLALLAPALSAQQSPPQQQEPTEIVLHVNGLSCPICAYSVEKKLDGLEATQSVRVDLDKGLVQVTLRPGAEIEDRVLVKTVKDAGFVVRSVERRRQPVGAAQGARG